MDSFFLKKILLLIYPVAYICISKSWGYVKTAKDLQGVSVCICACMFCLEVSARCKSLFMLHTGRLLTWNKQVQCVQHVDASCV